MKIKNNVINIDNLIVNINFLNNKKQDNRYFAYDKQLFCYNSSPFLEDFTDIAITQDMLLNMLHTEQQKAFQEIEENEIIKANFSF